MMHPAQTDSRDLPDFGADPGSSSGNCLRQGGLGSGMSDGQHRPSASLDGLPCDTTSSVWRSMKAHRLGLARLGHGLARVRSDAGLSAESAAGLLDGHDLGLSALSERLLRQRSRAVESGTTALRSAVVQLDGYLSRQYGVRPFTTDERCLLRLAVIRSPASVRLSDGISVPAGADIVDLHLWNEHIPAAPKGGPNLAWALQLTEQLKHSLRELARAFERLPEMKEVRACRAQTNFVGRGCSGESLSRIIERYGFEQVDEGSPSLPGRIHDLFENVLIGALVWTHNPEALRRDKLIRERRPVWISREKLLRLHRGS